MTYGFGIDGTIKYLFDENSLRLSAILDGYLAATCGEGEPGRNVPPDCLGLGSDKPFVELCKDAGANAEPATDARVPCSQDSQCL